MYSVYGDESADEKQQRIYVVAGLLDDDGGWKEIEWKWLAETKGEEFHANECGREVNQARCERLIQILAKSRAFGWAAAMSLIDFGSLFDRPIDKLPHYFCLTKVIEQFANRVRYLIPQDRVKFTFDRNLDTQYNSTVIYDYMTNLEEWRDRELVAEEIGFSSRKNPRIQAADLWAREVMKYADEMLKPSQAQMRPFFRTLRDTNRFALDLFASSYFANMKKQIMERHMPGHSLNEYDQWRNKFNMQDTTEHRIRYHIYLNTLEKQGREA